MKLYLMRHARAEDRKPGGLDSERELTGSGKTKAASKVSKLTDELSGLDVVLTSPAIRAMQTAQIVVDHLNEPGLLKVDDHLEVGSDAGLILAHLRDLNYSGDVMLVGHEPWLSDLAARLISPTGDAQIKFKKSAIMRIDLYAWMDGAGTLEKLW